MNRSLALRWILLLLASHLLLACSDNSDQQLQDYIKKIKSRPASKIEPLPVLKPQLEYHYQNAGKRSPFTFAKVSADDVPDLDRKPQLLETYPLDSLHLVGVLQQGVKEWGLIATPDHTVHYVTIGSYLGKNYGRVIEVNPTEIKIVEKRKMPWGPWEEKETYLKLGKQHDNAN